MKELSTDGVSGSKLFVRTSSFTFFVRKTRMKLVPKFGRAAPAELIPSREAAPPAPSAKGLVCPLNWDLNVSNFMISD